VGSKKAGFAKLVDASATMGAKLALARLKKEAAVVVQLDCSGFIWHIYDGLVFNGLLFIWGTFKK
jgi:hypothetical protein